MRSIVVFHQPNAQPNASQLLATSLKKMFSKMSSEKNGGGLQSTPSLKSWCPDIFKDDGKVRVAVAMRLLGKQNTKETVKYLRYNYTKING